MSAGHIDDLLELWAASLARHDDEAPFNSHRDLYETIDSTALGDVQWENFTLRYNNNLPDGEAPSWMQAEYDVWYRDPRTIIKNLLSNPDFDNEFDYSPVQEYDMEGNRRFHDFMTGDWAWKQAVRSSFITPLHPFYIAPLIRT
jgi:Plavaka transposase